MIEKYYGKRVEARNFLAYVYVNAVKGSQAALIEAGAIDLTIIPKKPTFASEYLYMSGDATHGSIRIFSTAQTSMVNILAICILHKNGFKFSTQPNWGGTNYGKDFSTDAGADNITMTEPNGFYKVEVNLVTRFLQAHTYY